MAQQFVLKGVKEIRDYTSTDGTFSFSIKRDPRGGDTWQIPQWWARKPKNTIYNSCTVFEIAGSPYLMIIPTSMDTQLMVTWNGDPYQTIFSNFSAVDRIAFTDKSTKHLAVEYLLPSVSGGAIAKRTYVTPNHIDPGFKITGKSETDVGASNSYQSNATSNVDDLTYLWTITANDNTPISTDEAVITAGATSSACTVNWKAAANYKLSVEVSSATADNSPQSDTKSVNVKVVDTVGTAQINGSATAQAKTPQTYTCAVTGNNVSDLDYAWDVLEGNATCVGTGDTATITFDVEGNYTVKCTVSSATAADTSTPTKSVNVAAEKTIGSVTVSGPDTGTALGTENYDVTIGGNIVDATYQWTVTGGANADYSIADATVKTPAITFNTLGAYEVKCAVSSITATEGTVVSDPYDVTIAGIPDVFEGVTLGGPQTVNTLNTGKNYTSALSGGGTLSGTTTYNWTAEDSTGATTENGAVFSSTAGKTVHDQDTQVVFTKDGETYKIRCKWTNYSYDPSTRTGMRTVVIDTTASEEE